MASLELWLALLTLFFSPKRETNGQIAVPVKLHTTVSLPCNCHIRPESTALVRWFKSSNSDVYLKNGTALASWSVGKTHSSQGFGINDDFSMMIYNLTDQHNQDLYRCIVIPVGGGAKCTHDVKLSIYANPNTSPVIKYMRETNSFNVTCSISNVFPMTFPILTTEDGKRTAYKHSDGSYNTAVTHLFPANEKDTIIECMYSYLDFRSMSSLRIVDSDTFAQSEEEESMGKNTTNTDFRCRPSGLWMVWIILIMEVLSFIVIVYAIKTGRSLLNPALCNENHWENSKKKVPVKSTRIMSFGKLSCALIALQTTILIHSVANLATARCIIEADEKLGGNLSA